MFQKSTAKSKGLLKNSCITEAKPVQFKPQEPSQNQTSKTLNPDSCPSTSRRFKRKYCKAYKLSRIDQTENESCNIHLNRKGMGKRVMSQQALKPKITLKSKPRKKKCTKDAHTKSHKQKRILKSHRSHKTERNKLHSRPTMIINAKSRSSLSRPDSPNFCKPKEFRNNPLESQNVCDTTEDTYQNNAGRSSTCSMPLTETSKKILSPKEPRHSMDLPLQKNTPALNCKEVSPILEDSKGEDTIVDEIEAFPSSCANKFTGIKLCQRRESNLNHERSTGPKRSHTESIKPYKKSEFVGKLANKLAKKLISSVKLEFQKEKCKTLSSIQKMKIKTNASQDSQRGLKLVTKEQMLFKRVAKEGDLKKLPNLRKSKKAKSKKSSPKITKTMFKSKPNLNKENRLKQIGLEFMKFIPKRLKNKKIKRKFKTKGYKSNQRPENQYFTNPGITSTKSDRSLHIEFEPNLENGQINLIPHIEEIPSNAPKTDLNPENFLQISEIPLNPNKSPQKLQSAAIGTSFTAPFHPLSTSDKNLTCNLLQTPSPRPKISTKSTSPIPQSFHARLRDPASVHTQTCKITKISSEIPDFRNFEFFVHKFLGVKNSGFLRGDLEGMYKARMVSGRRYRERSGLLEKWIDVEQTEIKNLNNLLSNQYAQASKIIENLEKTKQIVVDKILRRRIKGISEGANRAHASFELPEACSELAEDLSSEMNRTTNSEICNVLRRRRVRVGARICERKKRDSGKESGDKQCGVSSSSDVSYESSLQCSDHRVSFDKPKDEFNSDLEDMSSPQVIIEPFYRTPKSPVPQASEERIEDSFADSRRSKVSLDTLESLEIPSSPSMLIESGRSNNIDDPLMPVVPHNTSHKIQNTQNDKDLVDPKFKEQSDAIADQILHSMLCELDNDSGINKALNRGEPFEELPSFLNRGIQTDGLAVIEYLNKLFTKIRSDRDFFLESLSTPLNRDPLEILRNLQDIELDSDDSDSENTPFQPSILPVELYLEIEKQGKEKQNKEAKKCIEDPLADLENSDDEDSIMADWENIHNKVIFDCVNEVLDNYRPYGLRGPPLSWSINPRTLTYKYSETDRIDEVLLECQEKIMAWAGIEAGTLTNSDTLLTAPQEIKQVLTEQQFLTQVREERLTNLLSEEINNAEPLWLDYEYEETQVKLDLADMILQDLCYDTIRELNRIHKGDGASGDFIDKLFKETEPKHEPPIILQNDKSPVNVPVKATSEGIDVSQGTPEVRNTLNRSV
ncbi:unnamed protein product [Moneuplotes crassus]|uniref:DUF4378 domain-containing protein n=1 Tax=Euplotes crassus TaxID=5936 RepID=A0AAD1XE13_EUPCR|nr:unnamed protein product [Moneuplotes crassus]